MADQEHVAKLKEGPEAWLQWRCDHPDVAPDFSGETLVGFDFGAMDLSGASFRHADLTDARLDSVTGLLPGSLAGADLTRAELPPEIGGFPGLAQVTEISKHARVNFLAVIASCVFCWLAIAQTTDAELLVNRGQLSLPVIDTKVPDRGFFELAPILLLALYVYLHLYLQRMWDGLSRLPAVFPDGARLDQKAFPWLLSGLVSLYVRRLRQGAPPFAALQVVLSVLFAWLVAPVTIGWFWLRYLLVTDEFGLWLHILILGAAVGFAVLFYLRAHATLLARPGRPGKAGRAWEWSGWCVTPVVLGACLIVAIAATFGVREHLGPWWHLDIRLAADGGADQDRRPNFASLDLTRAHFRFAKADGVELREVKLSGDLSWSSFAGADLSGADLNRADFTGANLNKAILAQTKFRSEVRLDRADLTDVRELEQKDLAGACGIPASLSGEYSLPPCDTESADRPTLADAGAGQREPLKPDNGAATEPIALPYDCSACPEMIVVQAGDFFMGSPDDELSRISTEGPQHAVGISTAFAVGRTEVTFAQWDACVDDGGCGGYRPEDRGWGRGKRPVINVSWDDAQSYIDWLNGKVEGSNPYRLLSESEWEYVARAGTSTAYWWGEKASREYANYGADECCGGAASGRDQWINTAPVASFEPNPFGLHDTLGNVWEWVEDCWNDSYEGAPLDGSAWTEDECQSRVLRGGSWIGSPGSLRVAARYEYDTGRRHSGVGFRVARTLDR